MSTAETEALTMRISRLEESAAQTAAEIRSIRESFTAAAAIKDSRILPILSSAEDAKTMSRQSLKTSASQELKDSRLVPMAFETRDDEECAHGSSVESIYSSPLVELLGNILNATKQAKRSGKFAARVRKGHEGSVTVKTRVTNARDVLKLIAEHEGADQDNTNTSTLRLSLDDTITASDLMP
jgi:hypothetical protein